MLEKIDYQVKKEELLKEQLFLNEYGIHKETDKNTTYEVEEDKC